MYTHCKTLLIRENDLMMYLELHFLLVRAHNSMCRTISVKIMFPQEIIGNIAFRIGQNYALIHDSIDRVERIEDITFELQVFPAN